MKFSQIIAHRGASAYAPENTFEAFRKAKELGAEWIECDVQLTKDGEPIIFHDSRLNRTTNGKGWVFQKNYADIALLDAGKGEKIPLLKPLLEYLDSISLSLILEIKCSFYRSRKTAARVMEIVNQTNLKNIQICVSSFGFRNLREARRLNSNIHLGYLMDRWDPRWHKKAAQIKCESIHCSKNILTPQRVLDIKKTGRQVLVFTINDPVEAKQLFDMGVDAIFTDYPDLLIKKSDSQ